MKKISIMVLVLSSLIIASCEKPHSCQCKDGTGFVQDFNYETTTKSKAYSKCNDYKKGFSGGCVLLN